MTNITFENAVGGGTITSDGHSPITASGICFSTAHQVPSIGVGDTIRSTAAANVFSCRIINLVPGAAYYVRAFAINKAGIGYGNVVSFLPGNAPPILSGY